MTIITLWKIEKKTILYNSTKIDCDIITLSVFTWRKCSLNVYWIQQYSWNVSRIFRSYFLIFFNYFSIFCGSSFNEFIFKIWLLFFCIFPFVLFIFRLYASEWWFINWKIPSSRAWTQQFLSKLNGSRCSSFWAFLLLDRLPNKDSDSG